jgi:flavin reductase (DIM6/NTAB) family NADH-FMN oxidoreductase RutF
VNNKQLGRDRSNETDLEDGKNTRDHTIFIGEIVAFSANKDVFNGTVPKSSYSNKYIRCNY